MSTRYSLPLILLHWLAVPAMLAAFIIGEVMEDLPRGPEKISVMGWHILAGLTVAALLMPRIAIRLRGVPPMHGEAAFWEAGLARAAHLVMYAVMLLLPLTGLLSILAGTRTVPVLGLFELPALFPLSWLHEAMEEVHEAVARVFLVTLVMHVAATLWHVLVRRDGVLRRMLPGRN